MKLRSLIHAQLSPFKMQIETATHTIPDKFAFSSQIVPGGTRLIEKGKPALLQSRGFAGGPGHSLAT